MIQSDKISITREDCEASPAMLNQERLVQEFIKLASLSSESKRESAVAEYITARLREYGYQPQADGSGSSFGGDADNLLVNISGTAVGPTIMLNAHMDTVKPCDTVRPVVSDGYITSDGSTVLGADDKAGIACIMEALRIIKEQNLRHYPVLVVFTCAEEIGLVGAKHLNMNGLQADFGYVLDSHGDIGTVISKAPYQESFTVTIRGRAAHAGIEPEKGINAIHTAGAAISKLSPGRIDEETTMNIGIIEGGLARNIVPEQVTIRGEARSCNPEKVRQQIELVYAAFEEACKNSGATYEVDLFREYDGYSIRRDDLPVRNIGKAISDMGLTMSLKASGGGSDANIFNARGIPTVVLGIGMENVHTTSERISIRDLYLMTELIVRVITVRE